MTTALKVTDFQAFQCFTLAAAQADQDCVPSLLALIVRRRCECVDRLCFRFLAALCPDEPQEVVNFLWSMGLELRITVSQFGTNARIYRGSEILDEERA